MNRILFVCLLFLSAAARPVQAEVFHGGQPVLAEDALLKHPVWGLERTNGSARAVAVQGQPFARALRVTVRAAVPETNATQLTVPVAAPVTRGDVLLASFRMRGRASDGKHPAQLMFLFERATDPWTKSASKGAAAPEKGAGWTRVLVPFMAAENYRPGEAMVSLRFAFGSQTVEVGGLSVINYGKTKTLEELVHRAAESEPLGTVRVAVNLRDTRQTLIGFGGNFCQPRYGDTEPMDAVGRYSLNTLRVAHARVGIPLNWWTPEKGVYRDEAQARAAFLLMQEMARRKIPIVGSVWEGPAWMLGGQREEAGRTLPPERYADCIEAVARFLVTARDKYGVAVECFSFNEPDYGVNFKFTPQQMAAFICQAGPRFRALGLKTRFLIGDTASGGPTADYIQPLLEDRTIAPYLGPIAFHCWDALDAPDASYARIAKLGRKYKKPVWCTEAGHDAGLWQQPDPWESWENALRTALAYAKTLRLTGSVLMDYWTYQNNYPLVSADGKRPFRVFHVILQMEAALPARAKIASAASSGGALSVLAATGPKRGQFSVLLVNPFGPGKAVLTGLPPGAAITMAQSDSTTQNRTTFAGKIGRDGRLTVALPSRSVVTVAGRSSETIK
ncbi:MAG: hypothetical protein IT210_12315 [Armatimonadetes bacterium]|nr:hypothetical protein [Armatimonadota bacterium]